LRQLIEPIDCELYDEFETEARERLGGRDENDWPVLATALGLGCDSWTEDQDFFGTGIAVWTTNRIEIFLKSQKKERKLNGSSPRLKFGAVEAVREDYHAEEGLPLVENLLLDVMLFTGGSLNDATRLISALAGQSGCHSITLQKVLGETTIAGTEQLGAVTWQWPGR
jgi:PIN domain